MSAGAYGFSMSSNYNARPRIAEVLVRDDQMFVIRRREGYEDLIRGEEIPEFLTSVKSKV
jgi:diaminopimelate decarboxylase